MEDAVVTDHHRAIANRLFGEEAVEKVKGRRLHPAVRKFVNAVCVTSWNAWRLQIKRHRKTIVTLTLDVDQQWDSKS